MKEFGSAAPVLSDVHAVSDVDVSIVGQGVQADSVVVDAVSDSNVIYFIYITSFPFYHFWYVFILSYHDLFYFIFLDFYVHHLFSSTDAFTSILLGTYFD